jgi:hypothetical protein
MAKQPKKKPKAREDLNQLAARIVAEATGQKPKTPDPDAGKDPKAVKRGQSGGVKGGPARAASLSPVERRRIAKQAAKARWKNKPDTASSS